MRKFPVSAALDMPGAVFAVAPGDAAVVVVVVVVGAPGVIAVVAGVIAATGDMAAAAGLVIVAGGFACVPGGGGGVWLNNVSTKVTMQRLAMSGVFIGLIRKFLSGPNSDDLLYSLYPQRGKRESSKTFSFVVWTFRILAEPLCLVRIIRPFGLYSLGRPDYCWKELFLFFRRQPD